jgi:glycosyltransferase involved in cell wall biosynthesis
MSMEALLPITAAICTYNRSRYLALALAGLQQQSLPAAQFEILVVDNCSTDDTRHVVDEFRQRLPNLRYVHEARPGLSHARNTAMREARGRYLAYLDDDAIPEPQWLHALLAAFGAQAGQRVACVGGRIDPIWEVPRPDWLPDELLDYLTVVDWGSSGMALTPQRRYVAGANAAFELAALRELGGFDRTLTRTGAGLVSHDEILVERRLAAKGMGVYYEHEAAVRHHIPASRATREWLCARVYADGFSDAILRTRMGGFSLPRRWKKATRQLLRVALNPRLLGALLRQPATRELLLARCQALRLLGRAKGYAFQ